MADTFICAVCEQELDKGQTDEEAEAELTETFPGFDKSECDIVCDDCYKKLGFA